MSCTCSSVIHDCYKSKKCKNNLWLWQHVNQREIWQLHTVAIWFLFRKKMKQNREWNYEQNKTEKQMKCQHEKYWAYDTMNLCMILFTYYYDFSINFFSFIFCFQFSLTILGFYFDNGIEKEERTPTIKKIFFLFHKYVWICFEIHIWVESYCSTLNETASITK